jgi:hypothetical protein
MNRDPNRRAAGTPPPRPTPPVQQSGMCDPRRGTPDPLRGLSHPRRCTPDPGDTASDPRSCTPNQTGFVPARRCPGPDSLRGTHEPRSGTPYPRRILMVALALALGVCLAGEGRVPLPETSLQFFREDLAFTLEPDPHPDPVSRPLSVVLKVDGLYSFRNTAPREQATRILYPFPTTRDCGPVIHARVRSLPDGQEIALTHQDSLGIRFPLCLPAHSEQLLHIEYRQLMPHGTLHYILTTTQAWGQPLESATFTLTLPDTLALDSLSYPPTSTRALEHNTLYSWHFEQFMPRWDWVVRFSRVGLR